MKILDKFNTWRLKRYERKFEIFMKSRADLLITIYNYRVPPREYPEFNLTPVRTQTVIDFENKKILEEIRKLNCEVHGGGFFLDPQRPDDYIEDKPDEA